MKLKSALAIWMALAMLLAGCADDAGDDTTDDVDTTDEETPDEEESPDDEEVSSDDEAGDTVEITAVDYAFEGVPDTVEAGTELTLTNTSEGEVHEMVVMRVDDDETRPLDELLGLSDEEVEEVVTFAGVAVAMPGEDGFTPEGPVVLDEAGRYVMLCFIPTGADPAAYQEAIESGAEEAPEVDGGPPHVAQGMVAEFEVE